MALQNHGTPYATVQHVASMLLTMVGIILIKITWLVTKEKKPFSRDYIPLAFLLPNFIKVFFCDKI